MTTITIRVLTSSSCTSPLDLSFPKKSTGELTEGNPPPIGGSSLRKAVRQKRSSVLKNSFALSSASEPGAEYVVLVVFWPYFGPLLNRRPGRHRLFQQCSMTLAGSPRRYENELPPRLFSHQCFMALLAGPPRRDENKGEVVALVRRRLCLVPPKPVAPV